MSLNLISVAGVHVVSPSLVLKIYIMMLGLLKLDHVQAPDFLAYKYLSYSLIFTLSGIKMKFVPNCYRIFRCIINTKKTVKR